MNKTAIAIWGNAGQGKSSSIREIVKQISISFPKAVIDYRIQGPEDILGIVIIGTFKIGIESQGDPNSRLGESLALFIKENCDIIICATRTIGNTVHLVENLHKDQGFDIVWTSNYFSSEMDASTLNRLFAEHMIHLIRSLID